MPTYLPRFANASEGASYVKHTTLRQEVLCVFNISLTGLPVIVSICLGVQYQQSQRPRRNTERWDTRFYSVLTSIQDGDGQFHAPATSGKEGNRRLGESQSRSRHSWKRDSNPGLSSLLPSHHTDYATPATYKMSATNILFFNCKICETSQIQRARAHTHTRAHIYIYIYIYICILLWVLKPRT